MQTKRLSAHFQSGEFACRHCGRVRVAPELVERLEVVRAMAGQPIAIRSGYRCRVHNAAVGGVPRSQHLDGRAVDIYQGVVTVRQARAAGFTGIGKQGGWAVHLDVRPGPRAEWTY